jgi:hypothetical protein
MTVQTTYSIDHNAAYAGMVADMQLLNSTSRINNSGAVIAYGKGVVTESGTDNGVELPGSGSVLADVNGVVMYELDRDQADGAVAGIHDGRDGTIITQGKVWVTVLDTVVKDEPVFLRVGATDTGDFTNVAGSGATLSIELTGSKYLTGATAGNLALISLADLGG